MTIGGVMDGKKLTTGSIDDHSVTVKYYPPSSPRGRGRKVICVVRRRLPVTGAEVDVVASFLGDIEACSPDRPVCNDNVYVQTDA